MKKKFIIIKFLLLFLFVALAFNCSFAVDENNWTVLINGAQSQIVPIIKDGNYYLPIARVCDFIGVFIERDEADKSFTIDGKKFKFDEIIENGTSFVRIEQLEEPLWLNCLVEEADKRIVLKDAPPRPQKSGAIKGEVFLCLPNGKPMPFDGTSVFLTAYNDGPRTEDELKLHFHGEKYDYFLIHKKLGETLVDKSQNFQFENIKPGKYDLILFYKYKDLLGFHRVVWKMPVRVLEDRATYVFLDKYDKAVYDFLIFK